MLPAESGMVFVLKSLVDNGEELFYNPTLFILINSFSSVILSL
jgi:hypothetical protein